MAVSYQRERESVCVCEKRWLLTASRLKPNDSYQDAYEYEYPQEHEHDVLKSNVSYGSLGSTPSRIPSYDSLATRTLRRSLESMDAVQPRRDSIAPPTLKKSLENMNLVQARTSYSDAGEGIFVQTDYRTNDANFNMLKCNFGLIMNGSWPALKRLVVELNSSNSEAYACQMAHKHGEDRDVQYKVLFLARHAQGYDNLAAEIYGPRGWKECWSKQTGDGNIVWGPDAGLTPLGVEQAKRIRIAWRNQMEKHEIPSPQVFYVSPLTRALDTLHYTWRNAKEPVECTPPPDAAVKLTRSNSNDSACSEASNSSSTTLVSDSRRRPIVCEDLRPPSRNYLSDRRATKEVISGRYANLAFDQDFADEDVLWGKEDAGGAAAGAAAAARRETELELKVRTRRFLDAIFQDDWDEPDPANRAMFVSVTTHQSVIRAILGLTGHRPFQIPTGGMIPVLIKGTRYKIM